MPTDKSDKKESRIHERYFINGCSIEYQPKGFLGLFKASPKKYAVLDISQGGLQFISKEKFRKDTELLLNIKAPLFSKDRISVKARVARVKEVTGLKVYAIGVQFIEKESEQTMLKSLVDSCRSRNRSEIPDNVHLDRAEKV